MVPVPPKSLVKPRIVPFATGCRSAVLVEVLLTEVFVGARFSEAAFAKDSLLLSACFTRLDVSVIRSLGTLYSSAKRVKAVTWASLSANKADS